MTLTSNTPTTFVGFWLGIEILWLQKINMSDGMEKKS
jgi:hypothetical protein